MAAESGPAGVYRASSTTLGLATSVRAVGAWTVCTPGSREIAGEKGFDPTSCVTLAPVETSLATGSLSDYRRS